MTGKETMSCARTYRGWGHKSGLCEHYVEFDQMLHENKVVVQDSHILFGSTLENHYWQEGEIINSL